MKTFKGAFTLEVFMRSLIVFIFALLVHSLLAGSDLPGGNHGVPVLVELFTSEGCSSCPPADALLRKLDEEQPIAGAQAIVLSEHVDYWDHDGWKDAYSSSFFTARQEAYGRRFRLGSSYTPQIVVDGREQMNGSDVVAVEGAIGNAGKRLTIPIRISSMSFSNSKATNSKAVRVRLEIGALPQDHKGGAEVFVAIALNRADSHVSAGENKGRALSHVAVVESIKKVGAVEKGKDFDREVLVKINSRTGAKNLRLIAFIQEADTGAVLGAALSQTTVAN
jgi:hypothetical protein